ncbi:MAG TPA: hypothetical protein DEP35_21045, partial [Deltaproteobacteria bacterium]|nr:hypothetical protein [Deltaproteobacteria bacterium]
MPTTVRNRPLRSRPRGSTAYVTVDLVELSVVIPTLNEGGCIERTVRSALAGASDVLVVDGGSSDATRERACAAGARVLVAERGRARQLAAGAAATRGEAIVFLHADTLLPAT